MPLLSVYNNLIHGYVMGHQTRFDTHKRSELNDFYRRMRKLNAEQPLYKIDFNEEVQEYTLTMKEQALELSAAAKELGAKDMFGVFGRKMISSDRPDEVSVETIDGLPGKNIENMSIEVTSLAATQLNEGRLVSSRETGINAGQYSFTVEVEGNYYAFQYNVNGASGNKELQDKLADFINKTKIDLQARVVEDRRHGTSRIEIESKKDGASFAFFDTKVPTYQKQGIVEFFGINDVTRAAGKTVASINGQTIESSNNEYVTNDGIKFEFRKLTGDFPVRIHEVSDSRIVYEKVTEFVNKYNNLADYIKNGASTRKASRSLYYEMSLTLRNHSQELAENGIMIDAEGKGSLTIDREKMKEAIQNGSMENMFTESSGVIGKLTRKLLEVSMNPMNYVDKLIVVYPNTKAKKTYNPYVTSIYSGMMYNNYC